MEQAKRTCKCQSRSRVKRVCESVQNLSRTSARAGLAFLEREHHVDIFIYRISIDITEGERGELRTRRLPLILIHIRLPIRINDLHPLQQRLKLVMFPELVEDVVELAFVDRVQAVLGREPVT